MQAKPEYLDQLIERASKNAGSDYKLAQQLHTTRMAVSDWKHGRKPCPVGDVALMAQIAGLEVEAWTCRAVVAQYGDSPKGIKLQSALKKALAATGAALVSAGASAASIDLSLVRHSVAYFIRCILC